MPKTGRPTGWLPRALLACLSAIAISGCHYLRPVEIPMQAEYFHYHEDNSSLVLLLHGLGGSATNFRKYGTVEQILECQPEVNVLAVDAHFGYYREGIIIDRLREDIVLPALEAGVSEVWFAGVSLGGLASLDYRQKYPDETRAVLLMAPYIGEWDELQAYTSDPQVILEGVNPNFFGLWDSLMELQPGQSEITMAYGDADGFDRQLQWLAQRLDSQQVLTAAGGHRWSVWQGLWPELLERSGLCEHSPE